ncbi:hypothetical protein J9317_11400 [Metabacillus sp. KIGAM252]|uniref:YpoC-like domain-containing protein n=1 Tax=Metabacillus flavus TaxID=2823519 RepID=A0ABS5LF75_9BACI|nr:hypothetical protein [Metabacillus flavus]MBS2969371.1 hypothetical protein [Metabacillus flavus]
MPNKLYPIPPGFLLPPYINRTDICIDLARTPLETIMEFPLAFDLLHELKEPIPYKPWEQDEEPVDVLFAVWKRKRKEQEHRLQQQKKADAVLMGYAYSAFMACLHWMNGQHVLTLKPDNLDLLDIKPVNAAERLQFVRESPLQFHAFIQMKELFLELEKMHQKKLLLSKFKKEKPLG